MNNEILIPEIFAEAKAKAKEKFGEYGRAYASIMNEGERENGINSQVFYNRNKHFFNKDNNSNEAKEFRPIVRWIDVEKAIGSQYFFSNFINSILPHRKRVASLKDIERINSKDETFFNDFYTDASEIVLRTEFPFRGENKYILENLVKQIKEIKIHGAILEFDSENPLIISGLELIKDSNPKNNSGLLLKIGKNTKMWNDKRFAYSNNEMQIQFGKNIKKINTKKNGLSRIIFYKGEILGSDFNNLSESHANGKIVIVDSENY